MKRTFAGALAALAAALSFAAAADAATITVQIRSGGFVPSQFTVTRGAKVVFKNTDRSQHQVVADNGAFASPILGRGRSWTVTLGTVGVFRFHDALHPSHRGKVTVKGPPPAVTLALDTPIAVYGTSVTLSGAISSGAANQSVELDAQPWGQASPTQLAIVKTGTNGSFSYVVAPRLYTTFVARWGSVASGSVVAQVAPKLRLVPGGRGYMKALVSAPVSLQRHHLFLQRLSAFGQWVNVAALQLGELNGRLFQPRRYLPKGTSHIRVFLTVNQAGNGLLAAHSGTQTVTRR